MLATADASPRNAWEACERSYARGGGISGAEPDDGGTRTDSHCASTRTGAAGARTTPESAPSAVKHGIVDAQLPDAGPEHGECSDDAPSDAGATAAAPGLGPGASITMPPIGWLAGAASAITGPDIGAMPGTTHTAPPATMLRWPTNRASRRPAERRMRLSIS